MSWSSTFIGLPYRLHGRDRSGVDCWGLACLVYREVLGIGLPPYAGLISDLTEREEIAALIAQEKTAWSRVEGTPDAFDIAVFPRGRIDSHVAIMLDGRHYLHVDSHAPSRIEQLGTGRLAARVPAFYRHAGVPANQNPDSATLRRATELCLRAGIPSQHILALAAELDREVVSA